MSAKLENALYQKITTTSGVTSLLSSSTAVYPVGESPAVTPDKCILYQRVSSTIVIRLRDTTQLIRARYQLDCYARSAADARAIGDALKAALDGYKGDMGATNVTVAVRSITLDNDAGAYEPPTDGSAKGYWRVQQDYIVFFIA